MKEALYVLKEAWLNLFRYPVSVLKNEHVDYDTYWGDKRSESAGKIKLGKLTHWQRLRADMALSYMPKSDVSLTVLDVGCGDGGVLAYLREHAPVTRVIGVDISEQALIKARELGIETIRSQHDPLKNIPLSLSADYVCMFEVLEHMINPEAQLRAMTDLATRGVFFSFPNTGYIEHRLRLLFGRFPLQWVAHPSEHVRFWTYQDLVWWLKALGYREYQIHVYKGVPVLNKLWPSLFGRAFFVYLPKQSHS